MNVQQFFKMLEENMFDIQSDYSAGTYVDIICNGYVLTIMVFPVDLIEVENLRFIKELSESNYRFMPLDKYTVTKIAFFSHEQLFNYFYHYDK